MMEESELERILKIYVLESDNPDVRAYWTVDNIPIRSLIHETKKVLRMGGIRRARVLDVGCGFGWGAVLLAAVGENTIVANDVRSSMIDVVDDRLAELRKRGIELPITTLLGDICGLSLPENSFDAVHSSEAIEHVHDLPRMFRVIRQLLRPGGRGVFLNDSNALHPATRERTMRMWVKRDTSRDYIEELKQERPIENAEIEPYAFMRRRIIEEQRPDLSEESVLAIASASAGMTSRDICTFLSDYRLGGSLPEPPSLSWCRNPLTEEYCERLLDPFEIATMARESGLRARVWHYQFNRFPLNYLNLANGYPSPWLNRLMFRVRPHFAVVVEKP